MRKSRFTEAQIIGMIREQEAGLPTSELCRSSSVKRLIQWINRSAERVEPRDLLQAEGQVWRDGPVGRQAAEAARGRECEAEAPVGGCDARQRRAQGSPGKALTTLMARRDAVLRAMKGHPISQRRACVLIGVDPKTVRRERPPDNPEIREEMHKIAEKRRRFGYRRVGIMLERKGMIMNEKKLYRMRRFRPIDFAIAARLSTAWAWHCELVGESWTRSF